jgi:hypothetical protein
MTQFRFHRGGYEESMATTVNVNSMQDLAKFTEYPVERLTVKRYDPPFIDRRNGWDTYLVLFDGQAVGMTDGPVPE